MEVRGDLDFIPECYIDTNLTETLLGLFGHYTKGVNHKKGCNEVTATMDGKFHGRFAVGIIDDDRRQAAHVGEYVEIARSAHLRLLKHPDEPHYLIMVYKAMEDFIVSCAEEVSVDLSKYGLSRNLEECKDATKQRGAKKDPKFKRFFKAIAKSSEMVILGRVLHCLYEHRREVDDQSLRSCFD